MVKWNFRMMIVLCVLLFVGCKSIYKQAIDAGYPASFAQGFQDGHGSGERAAGNPWAHYVKNLGGDSNYHQGWVDGFNTGKGNYDNIVLRLNYH